jgi:lysophospholipid acyltransferase (LPLAT)-like uncharacterized protein
MARDERGARRIRWIVALGGVMLRALGRTWRIQEVNAAPVREARRQRRPLVFAFWHGQMLPLLWHHRSQGVTVLVSEHGDGEIVTRIAHALGYRTVRGSTTRGAGRALLGMVRAVADGSDAAFTPDGPRGPAETFSPGALIVSQRTGAPIVPVAATVSRAWRLRSWDRFVIPKPFARVVVTYGAPTPAGAPTPREAVGQAPWFQSVLRALSKGAQ